MHQGIELIGHICFKNELGLWLQHIPTINQMLLKIINVLSGRSLTHFASNQCFSSTLDIVRGDEVVQHTRWSFIVANVTIVLSL